MQTAPPTQAHIGTRMHTQITLILLGMSLWLTTLTNQREWTKFRPLQMAHPGTGHFVLSFKLHTLHKHKENCISGWNRNEPYYMAKGYHSSWQLVVWETADAIDRYRSAGEEWDPVIIFFFSPFLFSLSCHVWITVQMPKSYSHYSMWYMSYLLLCIPQTALRLSSESLKAKAGDITILQHHSAIVPIVEFSILAFSGHVLHLTVIVPTGSDMR